MKIVLNLNIFIFLSTLLGSLKFKLIRGKNTSIPFFMEALMSEDSKIISGDDGLSIMQNILKVAKNELNYTSIHKPPKSALKLNTDAKSKSIQHILSNICTRNNSHEYDKKINPTHKLTTHNTTRKRSKSLKLIKSKKIKKIGRVFKDTREDILHYKVLDNMYFKPLESNNSASIVFSSEEEITQDNINQAVEGRDGSYFAIPVKRKKDIYHAFLKWAHLHEQNERRKKIEEKVLLRYKSRLTTRPSNHSTSKHNIPIVLSHKASGNHSGNTRKNNTSFHPTAKAKFSLNMKKNLVKPLQRKVPLSKGINKQIQQQSRKNKYFTAKSVELLNDPKLLKKMYKKQRKKENKLKRRLQQAKANQRADVSAQDYSAQEEFMLRTQREAMGRRFYKMFANKSASDFWDNTTLETTKMLEFLLPQGKHLHKTLDKLPPNEGKHFMTNLEMYKKELEKFIKLVKADKAETRNDVVSLIEEPYNHVCETQYSEDEMKIMFGWDDQEFQRFEKLMEETREMWFDLQLFHHCYQFVSDSPESDSSSVEYNSTETERIIKENTFYTPKKNRTGLNT